MAEERNEGHPARLDPEERHLLHHLRIRSRRKRETETAGAPPPLTPGQRIADAVAATMGSWPFIIVQTTILAACIALNVLAWARHWDPLIEQAPAAGRTGA